MHANCLIKSTISIVRLNVIVVDLLDKGTLYYQAAIYWDSGLIYCRQKIFFSNLSYMHPVSKLPRSNKNKTTNKQ